jgi:hypothetical protein
MVINESLRVLDCRVVIGAFETVAFHKVTVEPNGIRAAVFRHGVYLPRGAIKLSCGVEPSRAALSCVSVGNRTQAHESH